MTASQHETFIKSVLSSLDSKLMKKRLPLSYLIIIYALDFSSVTFIQGQIFVTVCRGRKSIILMKTTLEFSVPT